MLDSSGIIQADCKDPYDGRKQNVTDHTARAGELYGYLLKCGCEGLKHK